MNVKKYGSIAALSAVVALGGATSTSLAAGPQRAAQQTPYGCTTDPKLCQTGVAGIRVVGGLLGNPGTPSNPGGTGTPGGFGSSPGTGKNPGYATGTRSTGGNNGSGNTGKGTGGGKGSGTHILGSGANGKGANGKGAGANGSSPVPTRGLPVTGFGGTAQDFGASPRASAAGVQAVVVGLASSRSSKGVIALPATGGGMPSQPQSPLLVFLACGLAVLGLGLRKLAARL